MFNVVFSELPQSSIKVSKAVSPKSSCDVKKAVDEYEDIEIAC